MKFHVDDQYVLLHAFNINTRYKSASRKLRATLDRLWENRPGELYFLIGKPEYILMDPNCETLIKNAFELLNEIIRVNSSIKSLLNETREYAAIVEREWIENIPILENLFKTLTGYTLNTDDITVYITHPSFKNGSYIGQGKIVWGNIDKFPNSASVYLCHEILHHYTFGNLSPILHSLIELAIDNELRIRLNHNGKYFEYGHDELRKLGKLILPYWKKALNENLYGKNILEIATDLEKVFPNKIPH
jgi:hypothetical protein